MGLDLYAVDPSNRQLGHFRVGPYTSVQRQRRALIEFAIKHLKGIGNKRAESAANVLQSWLEVPTELLIFYAYDEDSFINYHNIAAEHFVILQEFELEGLICWINHSDTNGRLSSEEGRNVHKMLKVFESRLQTDTGSIGWDHWSEMTDFFEIAADNSESTVIFA